MIGYGRRVLLVADDISMRRIVTLWLELHDFLVVQAEDGQQALGEMKKRHFDAVVSEYQLRFLNGLDLLLCARGEQPNLPIILVSEKEEPAAELATECGAFSCLSKPLDLSLLLSR